MPWGHPGWLDCACTDGHGAEEEAADDDAAADGGVVDGESGAAEDSRTVVVQDHLRMVAGGREAAGQCFQEAIKVLQALDV